MTFPTELLEQISKASITTSFVVDAAGNFVNAEGNSRGIGNKTDLELLGVLRRNSQVVLTSGLTARRDSYVMPKTADLAIFTSQGVSELNLTEKPGQRLHLIGPPLANSYSEAQQAVISLGYSRVHVEFGVMGLKALIDQIDLLVVSSVEKVGVQKFSKAHNLQIAQIYQLPDLAIATVFGRGRS